jgi:hypothetical protein
VSIREKTTGPQPEGEVLAAALEAVARGWSRLLFADSPMQRRGDAENCVLKTHEISLRLCASALKTDRSEISWMANLTDVCETLLTFAVSGRAAGRHVE